MGLVMGAHILSAYVIYHRRHELRLSVKLAVTVWFFSVFWYWIFALFYVSQTLTISAVQLRFVVIAFLYGIPVLSTALALFTWFILREPERIANTQSASSGTVLWAYRIVLRYPTTVAWATVLFSIGWYTVAVLYLEAFSFLPHIERVKTILNGYAVAPLLGIMFYVVLEAPLGELRLRLKEQYPHFAFPRQSIAAKLIILVLAVALGNALLFGILSIRGLQDSLERSLLIFIRRDIELLRSDIVRRPTSGTLAQTFSENLTYGEHGFTVVIPPHAGSGIQADFYQIFAPETIREMQERATGISRDYQNNHKILVYITDQQTGEKLVSTVHLSDFYAGFQDTFISLARGFLAIVFFAGVAMYFIGAVSARALQRFVVSVRESYAKGNADFSWRAQFTTGNELEEIAEAVMKSAAEAHRLQNNLHMLVREKTLESEKKSLMLERNNRELQALHAKDTIVLEQIGVGVVITDEHGRITFINSFGADMIGYAVSELTGKVWAQDVPLVTDENGASIPMEEHVNKKALMGGVRATATYYYARRTGERLPVTVLASPISIDGVVAGVVTLFRDVMREQELNRAKTEFVSLASHQLRTPVSIIAWYAETLLSGDAGDMTGLQKGLVRHIHNAAAGMSELINTFLRVTRMELGHIAVSSSRGIKLSRVCRQCLEASGQAIRGKRLIVREHYTAHEQRLYYHESVLSIVVENIISNAVRYTPADGLISVNVQRHGAHAMRLIVTDTGIGIPREEIHKIFQRAFRARNVPYADDTGGTGLGLYMVKQVISRIGGDVRVESQEGKGSIVTIDFPVGGENGKAGLS